MKITKNSKRSKKVTVILENDNEIEMFNYLLRLEKHNILQAYTEPNVDHELESVKETLRDSDWENVSAQMREKMYELSNNR